MKTGWYYIEYKMPDNEIRKYAFNTPELASVWMKQIEEEAAAHLPVEAKPLTCLICDNPAEPGKYYCKDHWG